MGLTFRSPIRARERILTYGPAGVGKSNAILTVARRCPDARFFVIDTEFDNYDRLLDTDFTDLQNVEVTPVTEWNDVLPTLRGYKQEASQDDWIVFDSITPTWEMVQEAYIERIFKEDMDEFFLNIRLGMQNSKDGNGDGGLDGWKDWQYINKMYAPLYKELLTCRSHVYLTAEADKLAEPVKGKGGESKEMKQLFGALGLKPKGQKRLGHIPQTVLLMSKSRSRDWTMNTVKDRGRRELEEQGVNDFSKDYLVSVAGWKPTKAE